MGAVRGYSSRYVLGYGDRPTENVSVWQGHGPREGSVPLILCHGFLGTATQWYDNPTQMIQVARGAGYGDLLAFGADLGGLSTWGNDDFVDAVDDLIGWAADNYGTREDRVGLYGTSMGGCCLNWVWRNLERVAACALTIPVVDLEGIHDRNPLGLGDFIEIAYGGEAGYLAALPTHDPSHPTNAALVATISDRVHIWYSGDDNVIAASEVQAYAAATGVEATNVGDVGHSLSGSDQLVVDWLIPRLWWE